MTIMPTTKPAQNVELANTVLVPSGSSGSKPSTLNTGIQPRCTEIHFGTSNAFHCRNTAPNSPYTTLGTAAIRSTRPIQKRLPRVAYSDMYNATHSASGNATQSATDAINSVPTRTAAMPKFPESGCHA